MDMQDKDLDKKEGMEEVVETSGKIRITLTSCNVQSLEKVSAELMKQARTVEVKVRGPVRMPTKHLRITTRKTPCGEGSKTWDRYQMRIHKRLIDVYCAPSKIKDITRILIEPGVEVEVTVTGRQAASKDAKPVE